jgi:exodeoxyribonuclease VII large subunit
MQIPLFNAARAIWSVTELTRHVRLRLEADARFRDVWVRGEASNVSRPSSGHLYFTLKDAAAALRCVMWRDDLDRQGRLLREGEAVEVHGRISVYEAAGQYQLYADAIRQAGEGLLYQEYLRLKERLEAEGLFDPARKRPVPDWPRRIGLVTSPSGAALRDVVHVLRRRFPLAQLILAPTPVQGEEAPRGIVTALGALNRVSRPDVILLVRGGGSMEDLWAFNDERVVRAVAASHAPVVTGVGHETDFVLADFAADRRAATPSAAAEVATPNVAVLAAETRQRRARAAEALAGRLRTLSNEMVQARSALLRLSPLAQLTGARQRVDDILARLLLGARHALAIRHMRLAGLRQTLRTVGPESVLARGYSLVSLAEGGAIVRSVGQIRGREPLHVRVADGTFSARADPPGQS